MTPINTDKSLLVIPGAICGDIIGSAYEFRSTKDYNFQLFTSASGFTDDTVCTIAIADALIQSLPFDERLQYWCRKYPRAGYGGSFRKWILSDNPAPYNSWGNGSAMRISPVGTFGKTCEQVLDLAEQSAAVTHNHPEGIKGAQATALAIHLALIGKTKEQIKNSIETTFGYDLSRPYRTFFPTYSFDVSCQGSVPEAIICFLESSDYESAIRKAIALGGDADTMAAIAGGIAAAYYGKIPSHILYECLDRIPEEFKDVITAFNAHKIPKNLENSPKNLPN